MISFQQDPARDFGDLSNTEWGLQRELRALHALAFGFTAKRVSVLLVVAFLLLYFQQKTSALLLFAATPLLGAASLLIIRQRCRHLLDQRRAQVIALSPASVIELSWSDEGLRAGSGEMKLTAPWSSVLRVEESPRRLHLWLDMGFVLRIPRDALSTEQQGDLLTRCQGAQANGR